MQFCSRFDGGTKQETVTDWTDQKGKHKVLSVEGCFPEESIWTLKQSLWTLALTCAFVAASFNEVEKAFRRRQVCDVQLT